MNLTPLHSGSDRSAGDPPPAAPPAPAEPPHLGDASLIWPPCILLAVAAAIAAALASALASALRGGWFSMETLGYVAGAIGYGLYAATFLWLDAGVARRLPGATWRSRGTMWGRTVGSALLALPLTMGLAVVGASVCSGLAQAHSQALEPLMVVSLLAISLGLVSGAVASLRARRRTRIA